MQAAILFISGYYTTQKNNSKIIGKTLGRSTKKPYLCNRNSEGKALQSEASQAGPLAQLNRASHYGCEGCRFESCMDHFFGREAVIRDSLSSFLSQPCPAHIIAPSRKNCSIPAAAIADSAAFISLDSGLGAIESGNGQAHNQVDDPSDRDVQSHNPLPVLQQLLPVFELFRCSFL